MPSAILELPVVEKLVDETTDDEFELDLRVTVHEGMKRSLPKMCQSGTCGCGTVSCYSTCTVENCGGNGTVFCSHTCTASC